MASHSYLPCQADEAGTKDSKRRITVSLCVNADATHKIRPQVIAHAKTPRSLRGITSVQKMIGIDYFWNKKSWQQASTFEAWIELFKHQVINYHGQNAKVLLIIDGAACHHMDPARAEELDPPSPSTRLYRYSSSLLQLKILFLPPRATSAIQPLDQGIIFAWKSAASQRKGRWQVNRYLNGKNPSMANANIRKALAWVRDAWQLVEKEVIIRSWQKTSILPHYSITSHDQEIFPSNFDEIQNELMHAQVSACFRIPHVTHPCQDNLMQAMPSTISYRKLTGKHSANAWRLELSYQESTESVQPRNRHTFVAQGKF